MVEVLGGRGATCPASNGGRRSCGRHRHWRRVPARRNNETSLAQKDRVLIEGVSNAHKSHGWGGSVGGDRGKRHVQLGVGWLSVSCERRRTVKRAKTRKWMVRRRGKKNDKSGRKEGLEKNQKIWSRWCSGGSTPDPDQEGSESRPLDHRYLRKAPT
jgi:hypothetical protein